MPERGSGGIAAFLGACPEGLESGQAEKLKKAGGWKEGKRMLSIQAAFAAADVGAARGEGLSKGHACPFGYGFQQVVAIFAI